MIAACRTLGETRSIMYLVPGPDRTTTQHSNRSNAGNIRSAGKGGHSTPPKPRRVAQRKQPVMGVIQRMPAGPGLKPPTLLMSEFGVVQIVAETKTGYTVRLRDGSTRDLPYGQLRTSVTESGAPWEFGFANVDRFSTA